MQEPRQLVVRLLDTPDIARVVPRLVPEVLHRLIERCGLEACADVVALATPRQLQRLLDIDLWRAAAPGGDETLDAARFGEWLEVLLELGAGGGDRLAAMDFNLVVGGLAAHVRVFDGAAVSGYTTLDGEQVGGRDAGGRRAAAIGGFVVESRETAAFDTIVEVLSELHADRPAFFQRVMRAAVGLSDGGRERDGLDALSAGRDQQLADLSVDRQTRRDRDGFVSPADARAFLQAARDVDLDGPRPDGDATARAYLRDRATVPAPEEHETWEAAGGGEAPIAAVMEILTEALSGCAIHERALTPQEAADLVAATCNLGLENWPLAWASPDLLTGFQIGWGLLHRDLCRHAAQMLAAALDDLACTDREVHWSLQSLRLELLRQLARGEPWRARPALDALLALDGAVWAVLRGLVAECPTLHPALRAGVLRVDPAAFTLVSANAHIAAARTYLASVRARLYMP
jgi:hypothetical protein